MPRSQPPPRIIAVFAMGDTRSSRKTLPWLWRPLYGYIIKQPLRDKAAAERVMAYVAGWPWDVQGDGEPDKRLLPRDWRDIEGLQEEGELNESVTVLRPSLLTDGECKADLDDGNGPIYRVNDGILRGARPISRRDVAHFIVEGLIKNWEEYGGRRLNLAY